MTRILSTKPGSARMRRWIKTPKGRAWMQRHNDRFNRSQMHRDSQRRYVESGRHAQATARYERTAAARMVRHLWFHSEWGRFVRAVRRMETQCHIPA